MTHDSAVRTIVALVPEIEKKGAEAVLLDHAERENIPPAQLEKLAQVFNTLRSLDHIDKQANNEDRGTSVNLVDVPVLVATYIVNNKQVKAAAPLAASTSSHNAATIDLMSAVRFDPVQVKAASAPAAPVARKLSRAEMQDAALDLAVDARAAMEKIARELLAALPQWSDGRLDMSAAIADAHPHCDARSLQQSVEWLKSASVKPLAGAVVPETLVKRAFAITGHAGRLLTEFNCEFTTCRVMRKMAAEVATEEPEIDEADLAEFMRANGIDPEVETPADDAPAPPTPSFVSSDDVGGDDGGDSGGKDGGGTGKPAPAANDGRISKVLSAMGAPIRGAGKVVSDAAGIAQSKIDSVISKERTNKDQMRSDVDVEDVRRAIGIRRMIGTDPVLRESDPREVLEIYNAISRTNPEIIGNMPALRLLLREAVSYEGLTLDSQKQLTDIRQNTSKSEAQEADNLKRRYSVGEIGRPKTK